MDQLTALANGSGNSTGESKQLRWVSPYARGIEQ